MNPQGILKVKSLPQCECQRLDSTSHKEIDNVVPTNFAVISTARSQDSLLAEERIYRLGLHFHSDVAKSAWSRERDSSYELSFVRHMLYLDILFVLLAWGPKPEVGHHATDWKPTFVTVW